MVGFSHGSLVLFAMLSLLFVIYLFSCLLLLWLELLFCYIVTGYFWCGKCCWVLTPFQLAEAAVPLCISTQSLDFSAFYCHLPRGFSALKKHSSSSTLMNQCRIVVLLFLFFLKVKYQLGPCLKDLKINHWGLKSRERQPRELWLPQGKQRLSSGEREGGRQAGPKVKSFQSELAGKGA